MILISITDLDRSRHTLNGLLFLLRPGVFVVLDLTPNYRGSSGPWFSSASVTNVAERLKVRQDGRRAS